MTLKIVKIATRKSPLALWQANYVKQLLTKLQPNLQVELVGITTEGDKNLGSSLAKIGGKGLFIKELENALYNGVADIAVHSMKDMTAELPNGLQITAYCPRADVRDAFVSSHYDDILQLPVSAVVGTSSIRRQSQLLAVRPDLCIKPVRGNVNTRLDKLDQGQFDALILAAAGLTRLDLTSRIKHYINVDTMLPAVGQGIIGIESRTDDNHLNALLLQLDCPEARACITAERAMNRFLNGGCLAPIAALATLQQNNLCLRGRVMDYHGKTILEAQASNTSDAAEQLGIAVAQQLLAQGAQALLDEISH